MSCANCHASNTVAAAKPKAGWVFDSNVERDYKRNILRLHDDKHLKQTAYKNALKAKGYLATGLAPTADGGCGGSRSFTTTGAAPATCTASYNFV